MFVCFFFNKCYLVVQFYLIFMDCDQGWVDSNVYFDVNAGIKTVNVHTKPSSLQYKTIIILKRTPFILCSVRFRWIVSRAAFTLFSVLYLQLAAYVLRATVALLTVLSNFRCCAVDCTYLGLFAYVFIQASSSNAELIRMIGQMGSPCRFLKTNYNFYLLKKYVFNGSLKQAAKDFGNNTCFQIHQIFDKLIINSLTIHIVRSSKKR